jgi:Flp pilus assembly protein TadG
MWQKRLGNFRNDSEGTIAMVLAIGLMVVLVGFISLAVDVGHLYTVRSELQNTCDAATLMAARTLVVPDTASDGAKTAPSSHLDAAAAKDAIMAIVNEAGARQGLPALADGDGSVNITFGHWEDKTSTWTTIGDYTAVPSNPSPSDPNCPNAVQVTLHRSASGTYGPVTNFFGGIFGLVSGLSDPPGDGLGSTISYVSATSRAYLGYALAVPLGAVPVPLALPPDVLNPNAQDNQNASSGKLGWFARLFSPDKAVAAIVKRFYFKDMGGNNVNSTVSNSPTVSPGQTNQPYWFTCSQYDSVPTTLTRIMNEAALTNHTNQNSANRQYIYFVDALSLGTILYPRSEFKYYSSGYYLQNLFKALQGAWNAKKDANGHWQVLLPVYGYTANPLASRQRLNKAFGFLAWLLGPRDAYACYTFPPPYVYVNAFVNVDITEVVYSPLNSSGCNQCSYSFPKTIDGVTYTSKKDCLARLAGSCWNANYAVIENVRDVSTIIPGTPSGTSGHVYYTTGQVGGLSNAMVPGSNAPAGVGGYGNVPRLIPSN